MIEAIQKAITKATQSGQLCPIRTRAHVVPEHGIEFVLRVAENLDDKKRARQHDSISPFVDFHPDMLVAELTDTHRALLNKYNVLPDHVLVVTSQFQRQTTPLTEEDFYATWLMMQQRQCLAFYNCGQQSGASQQHKHLQVVPLPLGPAASPVPIEPLLLLDSLTPGQVAQADRLPYRHRLARFTDKESVNPRTRAAACHGYYQAMQQALEIPAGDTTGAEERRYCVDPRFNDNDLAYNLLFTNRWILMVPRKVERICKISINGLGFAGAFFAKTDKKLQRLREHGILKALATAAGS